MFASFLALFASVAALSGQAAQPAQTEAEPEGEIVIMGAWIDPAQCNLAKAKPVTIAELAANADQLKGQCVELEGYWRQNALFRSSRDARQSGSTAIQRLSHKRIGLYWNRSLIGEPPEKPVRAVVVGRVGTCKTQWPGAVMVMGYCHYTDGPILVMSEAFFE
ncbi:MAG: hypothetical protein ACOVN5_07540 [Aquidulcibacter sp.]